MYLVYQRNKGKQRAFVNGFEVALRSDAALALASCHIMDTPFGNPSYSAYDPADHTTNAFYHSDYDPEIEPYKHGASPNFAHNDIDDHFSGLDSTAEAGYSSPTPNNRQSSYYDRAAPSAYLTYEMDDEALYSDYVSSVPSTSYAAAPTPRIPASRPNSGRDLPPIRSSQSLNGKINSFLTCHFLTC